MLAVPMIAIWLAQNGWRATVIVSFSAVESQRTNDEVRLNQSRRLSVVRWNANQPISGQLSATRNGHIVVLQFFMVCTVGK